MKRPSQLFCKEDRAAIKNAVQAAEARTSGEIVPLVAAASGRYDRAEDIFGLLTALVLLSMAWFLFQEAGPAESTWRSGFEIRMGLAAVLATIVVGFALGSATATALPQLKMPFIRTREMEEEIRRAATVAFHRFRVGRTAGNMGVLIYISLFERRVRIEGGEAVAKKLSDKDWERICDPVTDGLKSGHPTEGLCAAIQAAGNLLAQHFPIQPGDKNELTNDLNLIDELP